jgi:hypothetical protein
MGIMKTQNHGVVRTRFRASDTPDVGYEMKYG